MSEVDMVHALSWSPNFDLDESLSAATEALSEAGWPGAETQDVLTVVKLRQGQNIYRTSPEDVGEKIRARPTVIDEARIGLQVAVRALQECGIFGAGACPYSAQWILLGSVLDESLAIPGLVHGISMWLKATALGESFKGANATEFARARRHLLDFVHGGPALPLGLPREVEPIGKYDHRTARSRFLAWLLTDFGAQEDAARLLGRLGAEAVHQLVPGRRESPLTATIANRVVCGAEEMPMLRHRLNFGYLSESEQRRLYIPEDAARAWMMGDFERFLSLRMYAIEVAEAEMADSLGLRIGVRSYAFDQ